jgi:hypothetical protein
VKVERTCLKTSAAAIHPATVAGTVAPAPTAAALSLCALNQHKHVFSWNTNRNAVKSFQKSNNKYEKTFHNSQCIFNFLQPLPDSKRLVNCDKNICFHSSQPDVRQVHLLKWNVKNSVSVQKPTHGNKTNNGIYQPNQTDVKKLVWNTSEKILIFVT